MRTLDEHANDIFRRCRWAVIHNDSHPNPAWSTGEQLAVALVLGDGKHLTSMGYTLPEAVRSLNGRMLNPPGNLHPWLQAIRDLLWATSIGPTALPTPNEMFAKAIEELNIAYRALGDAADWLRSDWPPGHELTDRQASARTAMFDQIGKAKTAINRAKDATESWPT